MCLSITCMPYVTLQAIVSDQVTTVDIHVHIGLKILRPNHLRLLPKYLVFTLLHWFLHFWLLMGSFSSRKIPNGWQYRCRFWLFYSIFYSNWIRGIHTHIKHLILHSLFFCMGPTFPYVLMSTYSSCAYSHVKYLRRWQVDRLSVMRVCHL